MFTGTLSVKFGGTDASSFTVDSATGITAVVGKGSSGNLTVTTNHGTATDSGFIFKSPVIDHFNPTHGIAGDSIFINGKNFTSVTGVYFGGVAASGFTILSDSVIIARLGSGATGDLTITSPDGNASLSGFGYGSTPVVFSFTPTSGAAGSVVVISGQNFDMNPGGNIVYFGPVRAVVSASSSTQLHVVVPAGVAYDLISVTAFGLTAYSSQSFMESSGDGDSLMSTSSFTSAGNFNTADYPVSVSVADLDQDGKPDLITANALANSISVLQNSSNSGDFSFNTKADFPTAAGPRNIAAGDLNGDGKPDIVVSDFNNGNASYISVFENTSQQGIISFAPRTDISTGNGTVGVTIADINQDGKPDILVTSGNSAVFSILKNTSAGSGPLSFAPRMDFSDMNHADQIITADVDGDGKPDIVFTEFSNASVVIYRNTSAGGIISLAPPVIYPVGKNPSFLRAGDLDGDGKTDLVIENFGSGSLTFYKNYSEPGSIQFGSRQDSVMGNASTLNFADLNGDGKPDLTVGQYQTGKLSVLENSGNGTGIDFHSPVDFSSGNFDVFGNVGDLNGDGRPDLIAANVLLNTVAVFRNSAGAPVIISLSDSIGRKGETIEILGKGFTGTTGVQFGGVPAASFQVSSNTKILAVVNGGASGTVKVENHLGADTISGFRFIPGILYEGSTTFCKNTPFLLQSTSDQNNQWYKDSLPVNGGTGNILQVEAGGYYSVKTSSNGYITSSDSGVQINIITLPVPSISRRADNLLVSSLTDGNQWYFNGAIIPGATDATFLPDKNGLYTLTHAENGCISDFSTGFNIGLTELIDLGNGQHVRLYPNPVTTNLTMQWDINNLSSLNISISDLQGKPVIFKSDLQQKGATINLSELPSGYYILKIYNPDSGINKSVKIFKAN